MQNSDSNVLLNYAANKGKLDAMDAGDLYEGLAPLIAIPVFHTQKESHNAWQDGDAM